MTLHHVSAATEGVTTCGRYFRAQVACTGYWEAVTCKRCLKARIPPSQPASEPVNATETPGAEAPAKPASSSTEGEP